MRADTLPRCSICGWRLAKGEPGHEPQPDPAGLLPPVCEECAPHRLTPLAEER